MEIKEISGPRKFQCILHEHEVKALILIMGKTSLCGQWSCCLEDVYTQFQKKVGYPNNSEDYFQKTDMVTSNPVDDSWIKIK